MAARSRAVELNETVDKVVESAIRESAEFIDVLLNPCVINRIANNRGQLSMYFGKRLVGPNLLCQSLFAKPINRNNPNTGRLYKETWLHAVLFTNIQ